MCKMWSALIIMCVCLWGENRFVKIYDELGRELFAHSMASTNDGGYIIAGFSNTTPDHNMLVLKLLCDGTIEWVKVFTDGFIDQPISIIQTKDGGYAIAGWTESFGAGESDFIVVKLGHEGNLEWAKTYGGSYFEIANSIIQTTDGGYCIVGRTMSFGAGRNDIMVIKITSTGVLEWVRTFGGADDENGSSIIQTPAGRYVLIGHTYSFGAGFGDFLIIELTLDGMLTRAICVGSTNPEEGRSIVQTNDGGYVVVGRTRLISTSSDDFLTVKLTPNYNLEWCKRIGTGGTDWPYSLVKTRDNGYGLAGIIEYLPFVSAAGFLKLNSTGEIEWAKVFDAPGTIDEARSIVQTPDQGFAIAGYTNSFNGIPTDYDLLVLKVNADGEYPGCPYIQNLSLEVHPCVLLTTTPALLITTPTLSVSNVNLTAITPSLIVTDICSPYIEFLYSNDPLALAFNTNHHLARKNNTEELYLTFSSCGKILYYKSTNGGTTWGETKILGAGKFPAVTLDSNGLPSVTWTDEIGGLWYRRQTSPGVWGPIYHLYDPWVYWQPRLTSPPSITITPDDIAHVLVNLYTPANSVMNAIAEIYFPISNPMSWSMKIVENATNILPSKVEFPSITKDYLNNLHALWQHGDTIYYAYREIGGEWNVIGWQFQEKGINSLHPFIEAYGDSIFAVWENNAEKEVYKGGRWLSSLSPNFEYWRNFSQTPFPRSITPINASGKYVIYADELVYPPPNELFEIGWKTYPEDEFHNVSETPFVKSIFPHASLRKTSLYDYLYIVWQEGEYPPYEIRFKKIQALPTEYAYLSSISGQEIPSPYLIQRDTFFSNWQIPVDVGYNTLKYEFPLAPGYRYKIKLIAYHEGNGEWRARLKVDNKMTRLIKYNAFKPETITFWVPPAFYNDGKVELLFERIKGNYVTLGPIYVYRFEYEEYVTSGIQDFSSEIINSEISFKNIFKDKIELNLPVNEKINIYIYDVNGRLLKKIKPHNLFSLSKYKFPKGTYFIRIENPENGKSIYKKIIKME